MPVCGGGPPGECKAVGETCSDAEPCCGDAGFCIDSATPDTRVRWLDQALCIILAGTMPNKVPAVPRYPPERLAASPCFRPHTMQVCALPPTIDVDSATAVVPLDTIQVDVAADVATNGAGPACALGRCCCVTYGTAAMLLPLQDACAPPSRTPIRPLHLHRLAPAVVPLSWTFTLTSPNDPAFIPDALAVTTIDPTRASSPPACPGLLPPTRCPSVWRACASARLPAHRRCMTDTRTCCLYSWLPAGRGQPGRRVPGGLCAPPAHRRRRRLQRRGRRRGDRYRHHAVPLPA